jgi:hypothetical protein
MSAEPVSLIVPGHPPPTLQSALAAELIENAGRETLTAMSASMDQPRERATSLSEP